MFSYSTVLKKTLGFETGP